jgi:histidine triad (HIT) family protein
MTEKTLFEKIAAKEIPSYKIYEDDAHYAFLDIAPFEKGHTLVIPKKPYRDIFDMPEEEFLELCRVVYRIARHYEKALGCGINIWQNNKEVANQLVPHIHFHIVPRREHKKTYASEHGDKYLNGEAENYVSRLKIDRL